MSLTIMLRICGVFFCVLLSANLFSCSCDTHYYLCDYIQEFDDSKVLVLEVELERFIDHFEDLYEAEFLIKSRIREDVPVSNRFRLSSSNNAADCTIKFKEDYVIGSSYILAIVIENEAGFNGYNGLSLTDEYENLQNSNPNIWRFYPSLCYFRSVVIRDNEAKGWIKEDIFNYPVDEFLENINDCDLDVDVQNSFYCSETSYKIFPNPSYSGEIFLRSDYRINSFDSVTLFDANGREVSSFRISVVSGSLVKFEFDRKGIYFLYFECKDQREILKLVVL